MKTIKAHDYADLCACWAVRTRRHLCHLALFAKKRRARDKNLRRIIREYLREVSA